MQRKSQIEQETTNKMSALTDKIKYIVDFAGRQLGPQIDENYQYIDENFENT